jgi:hypothetical protein
MDVDCRYIVSKCIVHALGDQLLRLVIVPFSALRAPRALLE